MADSKQLEAWLDEINQAVKIQPKTSWTVARMRLVVPSLDQSRGLAAVDNVTAAGACNAHVVSTRINKSTSRIELETTFNEFDLRGVGHLVGPFRILLQSGKTAKGAFRQRYANSLFPLQGEWEVPLEIETRMGRMIPRPTEPPVLLRSAEPGEMQIPPIGTWFEKWDPISLVSRDAPEGPTLAIIEHAMHVMLNVGSKPEVPPFYHNGVS